MKTEPEPTELAIDHMMNVVGTQIRTARKERGLTLEALSEIAQVSAGNVSQIERGIANPSISTLVQLAHALGIPLWQLLNVHDSPKSPVVRADERRRFDGHGVSGDGATYELLTPDIHGALEVTYVRTPPGHDTSATPYRHDGEEFGIVLAGTKDVFLDGVKHSLTPGDSIRYSSTIPHWYVNTGTETCVSIWVCTPPTW